MINLIPIHCFINSCQRRLSAVNYESTTNLFSVNKTMAFFLVVWMVMRHSETCVLSVKTS